MSALVIVDVRVTDPGRFEGHKALVSATLEPYGGRFLARGGRVETLEGGWDPQRIVVLEFPTLERAKAWWAPRNTGDPSRCGWNRPRRG